MTPINTDTPLFMLTVSQFEALLSSFLKKEEPSAPAPPKRYVYGLKGICELFNCAHSTAQHLKDNVITAAVSQNGRKIVVDAELAVRLFNETKLKEPDRNK